MKKINIYILGILIALFSSCDTDVEMIQIQEGIPSIVESNIDENTLISIIKENEQNVIYNLTWTNPNYLGDDANSSVLAEYTIEIGTSADFSNAITVHPPEYLAHGFIGIELNTILIEQLGALPEETIEIFFRVESTFNNDVLNSNTISNTFIPYRLVPLPEVYLPTTGTISITGAAVGAPWPFPAEHKFTQVTETLYTLETYLIGGEIYEMVADAGWNQAYKLPGNVVPADVTTAGTFVEDGNLAHDAFGNEVSRWEGQGFLSPPEDGTYTISLDFQAGTYTVEAGAKPVIALPPNEEIYITGAAVGAPWPFPAEHKFTKESATVYSLVVDLVANEIYEMVSDSSWNQAYKLPADVVPADVTEAGVFVEDGNKAHDESGNEVSRWDGQGFQSPAEAGSYKITLDFLTGTYTVVKQ